MITSGIAAFRPTGSTLWMPFYLSHLARAHAKLGRFDEAWRSIGEAIKAVETTKETWCEAEIHRVAGEITLMSPESDATKAEAHFERSLEIARGQKTKSWELRAAMSMARLWRNQGKRDEARELLARVYGWFTEGFRYFGLEGSEGATRRVGVVSLSNAWRLPRLGPFEICRRTPRMSAHRSRPEVAF